MPMQTLRAALVAMFVVGCGQVSEPRDASLATEPTMALANNSNVACPDGTTYLASHRLCVSETEAVGPFTPAMIASCIKYGGGEGPCNGERWSKQFAMNIRGTGTCMPGSMFSSTNQECISDDDAYGPFSASTVENCLKLGGGDVCRTMRISSSFLEKPTVPEHKYTGTRPYLRLTRTGSKTYDNLDQLKLELMSPQSQRIDSVQAVSGQSYAQVFRKAPDSRSGSMEPLPEGLWQVAYPDAGTNGIEWAGGPGDYNTYFNAGLGPTFTEIIMQEGYSTERSAIGIHIDANASTGPGTAGCVGINGFAQLKTFVKWFSDEATSPRTILVDWDLGTLPDTFSLVAGGLPFDLNPSGRARYIPIWERIGDVEMEH